MMDAAKMVRMQQDLSGQLDVLNQQENDLRRECEVKIARIREQRSALIKEYIDSMAEGSKDD